MPKIIKFPSNLVDSIEVQKITLGAAPTNDNDAANKQYVDDKISSGVGSITETALTIKDKDQTDTADLVYAVTNLVKGGTKGHEITPTYIGLPTKAYVDKMATGTVEYRGTTSAIPDQSTEIGKGDFYRVSSEFDFSSTEKAHVGDILIATKDNPAKNTTEWDLIHTESDTWVANSSTSDGYVTKTNGVANKVWKTNESGVPSWQDDVANSGIAICNTAAGTPTKTVSLSGFVLSTEQTILLRMTYANSATNNVKLNVNNTGAKTIKIGTSFITATNFPAGDYLATYDGNYWVLTQIYLTDTTYESKTATQNGTDVSLVTTGEKYTWNNKQDAITESNMLAASKVSGLADVAKSGSYNDLIDKPPTSHASTTTTYGVADADNYGHAKASSTSPSANGEATAGSETDTFARGDHIHPLQETIKTQTNNSKQIWLVGSESNNTDDTSKLYKYADASIRQQQVGASETTSLLAIGCITTSHFISAGGSVSAPSFNATSDARLKENFEPLALEKSILDLPTYKFDFIDGTKNQIGCKAQDLQEICPEIVVENDNGYLSIQESKIVYLLLEEVKKLRAELEALKNKE